MINFKVRLSDDIYFIVTVLVHVIYLLIGLNMKVLFF